jgi:HKD family nuclease
MELLSQPFSGQLGDRLISSLNSEEFESLNVVVAFAKNSGVLRLKDALTGFRNRGGRVNIYVGVDLGGTSYEALSNLRTHVDALSVVHSDRGQTFHTKIYNFVGKERSLVIVGSHNLTGGGLWTNFESSAIVTVPADSSQRKNLQNQVDGFLTDLASLGSAVMPISTQEDIDRLLDAGYIGREVAQRIRSRKELHTQTPVSKLFAKVPSAPLPRVNSQSSAPTARAALNLVQREFTEDETTIWFETGKMTGGSRNILDLSMKSLVERGNAAGTSFAHPEQGFMRGGVEFFGLDPMDTTVQKEVTINFDGVDYLGNTILFPKGESANGTWRLQVKGTDALGRKITEAFRGKGEEHYLAQKVAAFTRIPGDYFYLTVFPESDLLEFENASRILARNGSTKHSRRLGLI